MTQPKNETLPLILALLITVGMIGAGVWYFGRTLLPNASNTTSDVPTDNPPATGNPQPTDNPPDSSTDASAPSPPSSAATTPPTLNATLPNPTQLTMDGSVTMVALMKQFQLAYTQVNPSLPTTYGVPDGRPNGTNAGIQNLTNGTVWIAASSRPLRSEELSAGLQGVAIGRDALAIVIGVENPYQGGLTLDQVKQIFQGRITNWAEVGGPSAPIRVINRSPDSGSHTLFQDLVLLGEAFAPDGPNFTTLQQDETTPMLRALGTNGIGYSTVQQVSNQQTVRIVPINGVLPTDVEAIRTGQYPISRIIYLVTRQQTSSAVQQFIDMALSPQGQQIVERVGFVPL